MSIEPVPSVNAYRLLVWLALFVAGVTAALMISIDGQFTVIRLLVIAVGILGAVLGALELGNLTYGGGRHRDHR